MDFSKKTVVITGAGRALVARPPDVLRRQVQIWCLQTSISKQQQKRFDGSEKRREG